MMGIVKRLMVILIFAAPTAFAAFKESPMVAPEVDKSTTPLTIENWQPKKLPKPTPPEPPEEPQPSKAVEKAPTPPTPPANPAAPGATPAKPAAQEPPKATPSPDRPSPYAVPIPRAVRLNEMKGVITSFDIETKTIRLTLEGGINPQLGYDKNTVVTFHGKPMKVVDLQTGDKVIVRYQGKDLTAREIEKISSNAFPK